MIYRLETPVPEYEPRRVGLRFRNAPDPVLVSATVDGPTDSPHRYTRRQLCLWTPGGPDDETWVADDGLLHLVAIVSRHLFQEAYFRETGEWPGLERPHRRFVHRDGTQAPRAA